MKVDIVWNFDNENQFRRFKNSFRTFHINHLHDNDFFNIKIFVKNSYLEKKLLIFLKNIDINFKIQILIVDKNDSFSFLSNYPTCYYFINFYMSNSNFTLQFDNDTLFLSNIKDELINIFNTNELGIINGRISDFNPSSRAYRFFEKFDKNFLENQNGYKNKHIIGGVVLVNNYLLKKKYSIDNFIGMIKSQISDQTKTIGNYYISLSDETFFLRYFKDNTHIIKNSSIFSDLRNVDDFYTDVILSKSGVVHLLTDDNFNWKDKANAVDNMASKSAKVRKNSINIFKQVLISNFGFIKGNNITTIINSSIESVQEKEYWKKRKAAFTLFSDYNMYENTLITLNSLIYSYKNENIDIYLGIDYKFLITDKLNYDFLQENMIFLKLIDNKELSNFDNHLTLDNITKFSYLRLNMFNLFPQLLSYEKTIYSDSDVIYTNKIDSNYFFSDKDNYAFSEVNNKSVNAYEKKSFKWVSKYWQNKLSNDLLLTNITDKIKKNTYFNSGLLIINNKSSIIDLFELAMNSKYKFDDQTILNYYNEGHICVLFSPRDHLTINTMSIFRIPFSNFIHFTGEKKAKSYKFLLNKEDKKIRYFIIRNILLRKYIKLWKKY